LTTATSTTLEWTFNNGLTILTLSGTGLAPVVANGQLTDITAGTFTGMQSATNGNLSYTLTDAHLSAVHFQDLIAAAQWVTLRNFTLSENDLIIGTAGNDTMLGGTGADTIRAGDGNDKVAGGAGQDVLYGGLGNDRLTGGAGADRFVFNTQPNGATNADDILDFTHGTDHIVLARGIFAGVGPSGDLGAAKFALGAATTAAQHVIYDAVSGNVLFDRDGVGGAAAVAFAHVTLGLSLSAGDFLVI
jgi:Ca2+-binding RTX toxin-like protein